MHVKNSKPTLISGRKTIIKNLDANTSKQALRKMLDDAKAELAALTGAVAPQAQAAMLFA